MHGITSTDSTYSVREMPWMGLLGGEVKVLDDYPDRQTAQKIAHPWEPISTPVFRRKIEMTDEGPVSSYEEIEGDRELVRSDSGAPLGTVSATRGLITNTDMWDVSEAVGKVGGDDVMYETAGSLHGGRQVWVLLRLKEPIGVKGDPHGGTLAFFALQGGYHRNSGAFRGQAVNSRIVCANTSTLADLQAKASGYEFKISHTSRATDRIEEAKEAVAMWREGVTMWRQAMNVMADARITPDQRELFVVKFQPMRRNITDRARDNVETARAQLRSILDGPTCEGIDLTAYGLYQAGLEWHQHYRRTKGGDEVARMEQHFKRSMLKDDQVTRDTLLLAREVAGV